MPKKGLSPRNLFSLGLSVLSGPINAESVRDLKFPGVWVVGPPLPDRAPVSRPRCIRDHLHRHTGDWAWLPAGGCTIARAGVAGSPSLRASWPPGSQPLRAAGPGNYSQYSAVFY